MQAPRYVQFRGAIYEIYPREELLTPSRKPSIRYQDEFEIEETSIKPKSRQLAPKTLKVLTMCDSKGLKCQRALDGWYINLGGEWGLYDDDEALQEMARL